MLTRKDTEYQQTIDEGVCVCECVQYTCTYFPAGGKGSWMNSCVTFTYCLTPPRGQCEHGCPDSPSPLTVEDEAGTDPRNGLLRGDGSCTDCGLCTQRDDACGDCLPVLMGNERGRWVSRLAQLCHETVPTSPALFLSLPTQGSCLKY